MELVNQAMYLGFGLIFFGLSFSSINDLRIQFERQRSMCFWSIAVLAMSLSCLSFLIYPLVGGFALTIGNLMQIASDIALGILFRSFNTSIKNKWALSKFTLALLVLGAVLEFIRTHASYHYRADFLSWIAIALSIWQLYELSFQYFKTKSIYIGFLICAITLQIIVWVYRIWLVDNDISIFGYSSIFDEEWVEFLARLVIIVLYALIFIAIGNYFYSRLVKLEQQRREDKENQMLDALKNLASARDNDTGNHIVRTQHYVKVLAERLRSMGYQPRQLNTECINAMFKAAPLHDIGKVAIPDHILLKPGPLNDEEWEIMKTHAAIGESVLRASAADSNLGDAVINSAIKIAGCHHERWDGTGYPYGLKAEYIPLDARIMSLADMYDALVTKRPYKEGWTHQDAAKEIVSKKGAFFDPTVVEAFIQEEEAFQRIAKQFQD